MSTSDVNSAPPPAPTSGSVGSTPGGSQASANELKDVLLANVGTLAELFKLGGKSTQSEATQADTISTAHEDANLSVGVSTGLGSPTLPRAGDESATALLNIMSAGAQTLKSSGVSENSPHYNLFLGGLVGVALMSSMMGYEKSEEAGMKIMSDELVADQKQELDLANSEARVDKASAATDAIGYAAKSILSAGTVLVSAGGLAKGAKTQTEMQKVQMATQAANTLLTGVTGNLIEAVVTMKKGDLDAQKIIIQTRKDIMQQMMSKVSSQGDSDQQTFDSFAQALDKWMDSLSQVANKLTPHG